MTRRARVSLGDVVTGELIERPDGVVEFRFVDAYLRIPNRPVLGQQFEDDLTAVYKGKRESPLPVFFANLLPEGRLRGLLERRGQLEERDDFGLLLLLGRDLPGALVVEPEEAGQLELPRVATAEAAEPGESEPFRFSLAGVQLKFSVVHQGEKLSLPARGAAGDYIVKLHGQELRGLAENEYSVMRWAKAAGFDVPECALHPVTVLEGIPLSEVDPEASAFVIRRYDREGPRRIHQEDFAQVTGTWPSKKYDYLKYETLGVLVQSIAGDDAFLDYIRRLALLVASGNGDAHAKNWSLVYPDGIRPELSPLYDQVFTGAWPRHERIAGQSRQRQRAPELALNFCTEKLFTRCSLGLFERLGAKVYQGAPAVEAARESFSRLAHAWNDSHEGLPMLAEHKALLRQHWSSVPCLKEHGNLA